MAPQIPTRRVKRCQDDKTIIRPLRGGKKAPQAAWAVQRVEVEQVSAWWRTRAAACAVINEAAVDSSGPVDQSTTGFTCRISLPTNMRD